MNYLFYLCKICKALQCRDILKFFNIFAIFLFPIFQVQGNLQCVENFTKNQTIENDDDSVKKRYR